MSLLPVDEALSRLLALAPGKPRTETVDLTAAEGRVLAQDIAARLTHPAFDNSAMDGYAGRHEDLAEVGAELRVIGQSAAGHGFSGRVAPGEVVRIFTGAPIPAGADTVLAQEDAETLGDGRIRTHFALTKGRHVRPKGQDFTEGDVILRVGEQMTPARLTVAAAMNHPVLPVVVRPKVAIIATGDELLPPGSTPGPDQIIASNSFGVAAIARENGAEVIDLGIIGDNRAAITAAVRKAVDSGVDVLVTLGGASVGDHDLVQPALVDAGMVLDFWKIAMRPGKPLMVGSLGGTVVLGLPGNPVSSVVCSYLFLEPLLRHLGGLPASDRRARARLNGALPANDGRQDYVRARLGKADDGSWTARPFAKQDSSMMRVLAEADCLIVRPIGAPTAEAGDPCEIMLLR
ncbi:MULTISPECIES: gephyrin-like molybdotransferase Glp [unclassified Rhizobium]|uniref:molybdopterin molybdotransferase MoeA n=1 Tax=unclassified Rhizobium TaxID=2613769 RepID=UPI0007013FFC|nr:MULTISPECIES: gephyrin-like molybdotransferase Glp [unclassified Rhizobium]KQV34390.1 molybdenum cofactor biosynthesis protein MoaA [Rhizobium sp. Root1212]KRD23768.1 molybdenum cofactor biosynthesis protein MoaA [Rhizobium sp. Root268]